MVERHERLDGFQLDLQAHRIAKRAIRIGEGAKQIAVLVLRRGQHVACAGEDVHLQHGLVGQAVAKRRRLDAEPGDRPAERDGLQLRHHHGRQPVGQGGRDEVLVGAHARHVGGPRAGVDGDDVGQPRRVKALALGPGPGAEQVRRGFGEPDGGVRRNRAIAGEKPLNASGVSCQCVSPLNRHAYTLVRGRTRCDCTKRGSHRYLTSN